MTVDEDRARTILVNHAPQITEPAPLESQLAQLRAENERLRSCVEECRDWFADRADVVDGEDRPQANDEMRMQMTCDEALERRG